MIYKQAVPFQLSSKAVILIDPTIGLNCDTQWVEILSEAAFLFIFLAIVRSILEGSSCDLLFIIYSAVVQTAKASKSKEKMFNCTKAQS